MRNLKVTIAYDGTNFNGWQVQTKQRHVRTVQATVQNAVKKIFKEESQITAAGRTDAGVHARGQVINFYTKSSIPADRVPLALNSVLPQDIVAFNCEEVDEAFHARYSAYKKWYRYVIYNDMFPDVFSRDYAHFVRSKLDLETIRAAASKFKGTHDFRSFCASGTSVQDFVRTVKSCRISKKGKYLFIDVAGDGFLYNMVRIIAGTLLEVGKGKIAPEEITEIIEAREREKAGPTAPAKGLYLMKVFY
ncbi:MAG: tRNA pseudouridine38-40 synthase [Clostridia bacterium]|jgi:tRNA pseudouridine38-40 synthase|nr:tRNA pseudouridine synthase [Clostridiales bacterium]MDK2985294.1 tRNA pseudouridine38-40 synthase [Clostridia bacterium]